MKKLIVASILALVPLFALASGSGHLDDADLDMGDQASLQRGAKYFVNYCLSCHSAKYQRYNRTARDLGLSEDEVKENLMFTTDKIGETMKANIDPKQAKAWFGANPPDLTVIARSRAGAGGSGADYLYTFLRTFYRDDTKATGWNNLLFPNVGMPHALWQLQGDRRPVFEEVQSHGQTTHVFKSWEQVAPGQMSVQEYDQAIGDLVGYLQWMGEPAQNTRVRIGVWVLIFLAVTTVFAWKLNAAFWKDVK